ncbi:MAG TPA: hypothetical protein VNW49_03820 [Puia sp.]|jgi:hypothetical protein|nr:hypothetical protein [Puia sp.]
MKNFILLAAILISSVACRKTDTQTGNTSIIGKWELSEYLADPGDKSGTWHPADSSNPSYIEFKADSTFVSTPYSINSWDHYQLTSDSSVIFFRGSEQFINWYHISNTSLTLFGGCIETCGERYIPAQ